jgi:uncharacterized protein (TIGR02246 family)
MFTRVACTIALILAMVTPALADSAATGRKMSDAFQKACSTGDISGVMKLYEDDATAIWPNQGEFAKGKGGIEKLAVNFCKPTNGELKFVSQESKAIGNDYIVNVGHWEATVPGPDGKPTKVEIRTTELLHRSGGKWRYAVDHASIGLTPPPAASAEKPASH